MFFGRFEDTKIPFRNQLTFSVGMVAFSSVGAQNAQNNTNQSTQESSKPIIERHSLTNGKSFII